MTAIAVAHGFGRSIRPAVTFGIGVIALPAVWTLVDRLNGPGADNVVASAFLDPGYIATAADRIPVAAGRLFEEIADGCRSSR